MNSIKSKKGLLNALDVALIIVIISVVVAALFRMNNKQIFMLFDKSESSRITLSIVTDEYTSSDFKSGDTLYFLDSDKEFGTIITARDIKEKRYSAINNTLSYDYTDKTVGVQLEIEARLKENQSKKFINSSVFIAVGSEFKLHTKGLYDLECVVDEILVLDD